MELPVGPLLLLILFSPFILFAQEPTQPGTITDTVKAWAEITEAIVTAGGIIVAGIWTYLLFVKKREAYPRAEISHGIVVTSLSGEQKLLRVVTHIANIGTVALDPNRILIRIQRIAPLPAGLLSVIKNINEANPRTTAEFPWTMIGRFEQLFPGKELHLEPNETQTLEHDFAIDNDVGIVLIYSYVSNSSVLAREIGWSKTTITAVKEGIEMIAYKASGQEYETKQWVPKRDPEPTPPLPTPQFPPKDDPLPAPGPKPKS